MSALDLAIANLLSPILLFFVLGALAAALRSDLDIPASIGKGLALYLVVAIGFKGGLALAHEPLGLGVAGVLLVAVALSIGTPLVAYLALRAATRLGGIDAAAVAAAYGSVSAVTFVTAAAFLDLAAVDYAGWMVAILAVMEFPAILAGLVLASRHGAAGAASFNTALRESLVSGSVLLLLGGLAIGFVTGDRGAQALGSVLIVPFQGALAFFLLDMGLIVVRRLRELPVFSPRLLVFALVMPLVGASVGLAAAAALGLGVGDATLLAVLAGSASYIAVPAAFRHALPEANPGLYVTLPLAITFPFNVLIGIPIYFAAARVLVGGA